MPDLGGRLRAAAVARRRTYPRTQAIREPRAARLRRDDQRDELRAAPPIGDQGGPARRRVLPRAGADAADLRCARRSAHRHRLRADGGRSDHLCRCVEHPRTLRHRGAERGARAVGKRPGRIREAERPAHGAHRGAHDRDAADGARGRGRGGARRGRRCPHSRRCPRGRGARRGKGACRHCAAGRRDGVSPSPRPVYCCRAGKPR